MIQQLFSLFTVLENYYLSGLTTPGSRQDSQPLRQKHVIETYLMIQWLFSSLTVLENYYLLIRKVICSFYDGIIHNSLRYNYLNELSQRCN